MPFIRFCAPQHASVLKIWVLSSSPVVKGSRNSGRQGRGPGQSLLGGGGVRCIRHTACWRAGGRARPPTVPGQEERGENSLGSPGGSCWPLGRRRAVRGVMSRRSQAQGWAPGTEVQAGRAPGVPCALERPHPSPCPSLTGQRAAIWQEGRLQCACRHAAFRDGGQPGSQLPPLSKQGLRGPAPTELPLEPRSEHRLPDAPGPSRPPGAGGTRAWEGKGEKPWESRRNKQGNPEAPCRPQNVARGCYSFKTRNETDSRQGRRSSQR